MISPIEKHFKLTELYRSANDDTDDWGIPIEDFSKLGTIYGRIRQLSSAEVSASSVTNPKSTHRFYCFPTDIKVNDRLYYKSEYYRVTGVNDVMDFDTLYQVDCEKYGIV